MRYVHYWDAVHERISLVSAHASGEMPPQGTDLWSGGQPTREDDSSFENDLAVTRASIAAAMEVYARKQPFLLMLDFQLHSLRDRRRRQRIVALFAEISPMVKPYIVVRVVGLPPGTPSSAIIDAVSFTRSLSPHVCLVGSRALMEHEGLSGCGGVAISLAIEQLTREAAETGRSKTDLPQWLKAARAASNLVMVEDVTRLDQLEACIAQGVRFLAGDAIMPESQSLSGPIAISRRAILSAVALVD
ncbi:MAG: hypothetical protein H6923_09920 [Alphaproteobacteria bacterium]|nr:hypothetical protein [Alphaproteobacteria bacterium]